jgi:hypothetical protein
VTIFDRQGVELTDIAEAAKKATPRGRKLAQRDSLHGFFHRAGTIMIDYDWETMLVFALDDSW